MKNKILDTLDKLIQQINYHNDKYHSNDNPEITDADFDLLCKEYDEIIKKYPQYQFLERKSVGSKPSNQFQKHNHRKPMGSLINAFTFEDVSEFITRTYKFLSLEKNFKLLFTCEPKIDGLSISLSYYKGNLLNAVTRGDGNTGEIVTENVKTIKDIPHRLKGNYPQFVEIRGEIFMKKNNFEELNKIQLQSGKKIFANARNAAAGSIRQKDLNILKNRKLNFFAFSIGDFTDDFDYKNQVDLLRKFQLMGVKTNNKNIAVHNIKDMKIFYSNIVSVRDKLEYEIDGVVYKVSDKKLQDRLGNLSRAPRWAIAHKLPPEIVETELYGIETQVGRTGALTPVGKLKPVRVGGVLVSNVSLHNEDEISRKDIRVGDIIKIQRAGDVIPQVVEVVKEKRKQNLNIYVPSEVCPSCNNKTHKTENEAIRRCVSGVNCPAQAVEKLKHFVSKNALNIEGLGNKLIEMLYGEGIVRDFSDIFNIKSYKDKLENKEGFGELSVSKLLNSIESKKKITLDRLIYALGIRQIGETNSKLLALNYSSFENFCNEMVMAKDKSSDSFSKLVSIDQIGESIAEDLVIYFNSANNLAIFKKLLNYLNIEKMNNPSINSPYYNKVVVLTGTLKNMSRDEAKQTLQNLGAKVNSSVSKNTDVLIIGDQPGSKAKKAKELNIQIIEEKEWIEIVNGLKTK